MAPLTRRVEDVLAGQLRLRWIVGCGNAILLGCSVIVGACSAQLVSTGSVGDGGGARPRVDAGMIDAAAARADGGPVIPPADGGQTMMHTPGMTPPACVKDCVEMRWVPAGTFLAGANGVPGESNPQHTVTLTRGFWMDKYEVSAARFAPCVDEGVCSEPGGSFNVGEHPDRAVYGIPWDLARQYCAWTGKRLPTEAEWEHAACNDGVQCFPWGGEKMGGSDCSEKPNCDQAAHCLQSGCAGGPCYGKPEPVQRFEGNGNVSPFGIVNMAGNVWEWVEDSWTPRFDWCAPSCTDPLAPMSDSRHVMKGGAWISEEVFLRCAARYHDGDGGFPDFEVGIRCVADDPNE